MAADFQGDLSRKRSGHKASPRLVATLVQAILHGLSMQRAADPDCYDKDEMLELVLELLGGYLQPSGGAPTNGIGPRSTDKAKVRRPSRPRRSSPVRAKKVNHA
jgi:hypothetical protein